MLSARWYQLEHHHVGGGGAVAPALASALPWSTRHRVKESQAELVPELPQSLVAAALRQQLSTATMQAAMQLSCGPRPVPGNAGPKAKCNSPLISQTLAGRRGEIASQRSGSARVTDGALPTCCARRLAHSMTCVASK